MEASTLARLAAEAAELGVPVDETTAARLGRYLDELVRWGRRINLTSSLDEAALARHTVDSLVIVPHVPVEARVVDVGSGGGFPGIVLACARPAQRITLVESVGKKAAFLAHAARSIGLSQVVVENRRAESLSGSGFDVAVSRAAMAPAEWLALGRRLVRPGGLVLCMAGELDAAGFRSERLGYQLSDGTRHVLLTVVA
jgi:16S rRNA (guanine527-N7)-methyltransferase